MKIELWPTDRLIEYARNARKISDKAVDKVAASIQEFGWQQPIVVDKDGVIVVGHTRRRAAVKLGQTEVPVYVAADLTPAQVKAYRLMDNRSHQESAWDVELLGAEIGELKGLDLDLSLTGFDLPEIDSYLQLSALMEAQGSDDSGDETSSGTADTGEASDTEDDLPSAGGSIDFTEEQLSMVQLAVARKREQEGDDQLTEGRAIELICQEWMS